MPLLLVQSELVGLPWEKIIYGAQGFAVLAIILFFFLRVLPTWKEIKLKEFDTRDKDSEARVAQSQALKSVSTVLYEVAVEQRRAADSVKILQRVNSRNIEDFEHALNSHEDRIAEIEKNVGTHGTTAQPAAAH